jgi:hypothetical protein
MIQKRMTQTIGQEQTILDHLPWSHMRNRLKLRI